MSQTLTIRAFDKQQEADWEAWVRLTNTITPEYATTVAEQKSSDERQDDRCERVRFFGEVAGQVVGACSFSQSTWEFHPQHYHIRVQVLPQHEGSGYGGALYDHLLAELTTRNALKLKTHIREDWVRGLRFARERGFEETMREWESRLDVAAFDPAPFAEARLRPGVNGIVIRSIAELATDPDRDRKLWGLENETGRDVPSTDEYVPLDYDAYERMVLKSPNLIPEGFIVAVEEATGKYVGSSNIWRRQADSDLATGLTAVRREYRRMGIALAMKLRVIDYAKSVGAPTIRTENATTNRAMLSINEALGFVKQPVWMEMTRRLAPA